MAHALVLQVRLPDGADPEEGLRMLREQVVPQAKAQPGFTRGTWMRDGATGMGVIVFDTSEHAEAAKEFLGPPPGGPQLLSSAVYEIGAEA